MKSLRIGWTVAALALAGWAAAHGASDAGARTDARRLLEETGLSERAAARAADIGREPDPFWTRLAVARLLVAEAVEPSAFGVLPARRAMEEAAAAGERLALAGMLARAAAAQRPAVWQAHMLDGAATYLAWARQGRRELYTHGDAWRRPLERALVLAPGKAEPCRALAAATIDIWEFLDGERRAAARPTLEAAFADPATFARLAPAWLAAATDLEQALSVIPPAVAAWTKVEQILAGQRAWQAAAAVRERQRSVLERSLAADVRELERRVAGGDVAGARRIAAEIAVVAPPDRRYADHLAAVWRVLPPTAVDPASRPRLRAWLSWAVEGFVRGRELLPTTVLERLLAAVGDLAPHERALALLSCGRGDAAETLARRAEDLNTEPWWGYWIAAARSHARAGERESARRALEMLPAAERRRLPAALVAVDDSVAPARSLLAATEWPATEWRWRGRRAALDLVPAAGGELELAFDVVPTGGAMVDVGLEFTVVRSAAIAPGGVVRIPLPDRALSALRLTVEPVAGGRVAPGAVRLVEEDG
jgi:hypothetical protein